MKIHQKKKVPKGTLVHGEVYKGEAQKNKIKVYIIIKKIVQVQKVHSGISQGSWSTVIENLHDWILQLHRMLLLPLKASSISVSNNTALYTEEQCSKSPDPFSYQNVSFNRTIIPTQKKALPGSHQTSKKSETTFPKPPCNGGNDETLSFPGFCT